MRVFLSVHLVNCLAILTDRQVRQRCTFEITLKTILLFPYAYRIFFTWTVTWIAIFLNCYPRFKDWLDNRIYIDFLGKIIVFVAWYVVENNVWLEVIPKHSPTMFAFTFFLFTWTRWPILNTIIMITCT